MVSFFQKEKRFLMTLEAEQDKCFAGIGFFRDLIKVHTSTPKAKAMIKSLERAIEEVVKGVRGLRNLKNSRSILDICIEINRLENEGDRIYRNALSVLFNSPSDPIEIIKWKDIYETLEEAIDTCEDVANIIEGIVLEN